MCEISVSASADVIQVPTTEYPTIQVAINKAHIGDTILVHKGTYRENVVVNKSLSIIGEDRDLTVIDGKGAGNVVSIININNVSIQGFTIINSGTLPDDSGIYIDHSVGNNISHNNVSNTYNGIYLRSSSNNAIADNILSSNEYGVHLWYSVKNLILGNTISANIISGMWVTYYSINNTIYHNNFNNTRNIQIDLANFWDYEGEGNYWNDYPGQDLDQNGISDAPRVIDEFNQDNYPLMGMFYDFKITLEKETYSVTVISNSSVSAFKFQIGSETGNKIINFNVTGEYNTTGFCRVKIPTKLMNYPYIVLVDDEKIIPTILNVSNESYAYLYFAYSNENQTITIIYSEALHLYNELLNDYLRLQEDLHDLNETYRALLENYNILLSNYTQLKINFDELNNSLQEFSASLNKTYSELLDSYLKLHMDLNDLNQTYRALLSNYSSLLYNYSELQISFHGLNDSYLEHLMDYSQQIQNIRNLTYIFAVLTAIFVITTIYLSKHAHTNATTRTKAIEEK
jgi:parallel beta-helix repeat protein